MSARGARRLRRIVQVVFLLAFLAIGFVTVQDSAAGPLAQGLLPFDPLASLTAMLGSGAWLPGMAWALAVVLLTLALGRVWCGWICPLGTVLEYVRFKGARRRAQRLPERLRVVKYGLLTAVVVMAALGSLTLVVMDPVTLFERTVATAVVPATDAAVRGVESVLAHLGPLAGSVEWIDNTLRGRILPHTEPLFAQGVVIALVFLAVVGLNALADRFWCRTLCPLGALLGLLAKVAPLRPLVAGGCDGCRRCAGACRLGAIEEAPRPAEDEAASPPVVVSSECTVCLDCLVACPGESAMRFGRTREVGPWRPYDPGRRTLITAAAGGVGAATLLGAGPWHRQTSDHLLRPPGVTDEGAFQATCLRCGVCLNVCPTSGLQPASAEAGLSGFWTPVLRPRLGECRYTCNACGQVCPSGAIPPLRLSSKRRQVIGLAVIDRDRCLPWSRNAACVVCNEVCPVPRNAVKLRGGRTVRLPGGGEEWIVYPHVAAHLCIGCGSCEMACPVVGTAAIRVWPVASLASPAGGQPLG